MSYSSGGIIQAVDYNAFAASCNAVWGVGAGDSGYGQSTTLSTVSGGVSTVTATQWSDLITRIDSMRTHQSGATSGITKPSAGGVVSYLSTLSSQVSTITTNRMLAAATGTPSSTSMTNATNWVTSSVKEFSLTWSSANAMRYFFNAGGIITFTGINTALAGNTKSTDWQSLVNACGTIVIAGNNSFKSGGSGTPTTYNTNLGFYAQTTSYNSVLVQYSTTVTGGYNTNYMYFDSKLNGVPGSSTVMNVRMTMIDAASDTSIPSSADIVTGTVRLDATVIPPSTSVLTDTWGTVTVATVTNTQS